MSKNLLLLTSSFPRHEGDLAGNFVCELAKKLKEKAFKIVVLCPHHPDTKIREYLYGLNVYRFPYFYPFSYQKLYRDGGIVYNWKNSYMARIQGLFFLLSELFNAIKTIRKERIDLIASHWLMPQGLVGAICKKLFGTKHVLTVHAAGLFSLERLPFKMKIADFILKNTCKIVVVSSHIGSKLLDLISSDLRKEVKRKMVISPMGVARVEFQHMVGNKEKLKSKYGINSRFTLLFIGRLVKKKGVSYLVKAMPRILSQVEANLMICGDGPLRRPLEDLVRKTGLDEAVKFAGYVNDREKMRYLFLSNVLIVPSIVTRSGDTEGLPVVILEGLAAGKPIIASDVSGIKDVIQNGYNGFLVEPRNPEQIARKVVHLLNDEKLRVTISKNALESSKEYDWNVIAGRYIDIFREISAS